MGLAIGDSAPHFAAKDDQGNDFDSATVLGKKTVIIYFYPKNFTPGCTKEACDFRDSYADFKEMGAEVIGISADTMASHAKFKDRYSLPFVFLSDANKKIRKLFGVKSELLGLLPGRETFVIDKNGIIQLQFNSINASKHIKKALTKVKELTAGE